MACSGNQSLVSWILCTHALPLSRFSVFLKVWKILAFAQILSARNKVAFYRHTFGSLATVAWAQKQSHVLNFTPAGFLHLFQENLGLSSRWCWSVGIYPRIKRMPCFCESPGDSSQGCQGLPPAQLLPTLEVEKERQLFVTWTATLLLGGGSLGTVLSWETLGLESQIQKGHHCLF